MHVGGIYLRSFNRGIPFPAYECVNKSFHHSCQIRLKFLSTTIIKSKSHRIPTSYKVDCSAIGILKGLTKFSSIHGTKINAVMLPRVFANRYGYDDEEVKSEEPIFTS